ncbi:MAG: 4-hydroxy-3-methylbut-2-enyl diphosphate reductase [Phycisphaerales bacterium]
MKLILANPRGFCAGVHMAVDVVGILLDTRPDVTVYVYHEIVHNRHVVERFVDRGAVFVDSLEEVPHGSIVVFSAHGVSPAMRKLAEARGLIAVDATCPLVTKVHSEAVRYARQGYQILLVGHRNHQEVIGTMGEAPDVTQVVESPADIANLSIKDPAKLVYLTQTTLSTDDAGVIIDALKKAFPMIKEPPGSDICYATTNRQAAVRQIAPECDAVLVVGSRNSSNSVRLTEISQNVGTRAYLLDDASELQDAWFKDLPGAGRDATVMVTAGASAGGPGRGSVPHAAVAVSVKRPGEAGDRAARRSERGRGVRAACRAQAADAREGDRPGGAADPRRQLPDHRERLRSGRAHGEWAGLAILRRLLGRVSLAPRTRLERLLDRLDREVLDPHFAAD